MLQMEVDHARIETFCRRNAIRKLSIFGSFLHGDVAGNSDVDVLVEFLPGQTPGYRFFELQEELASVFGRPVDLNTPQDLSKYFREQVLQEAETIYDVDA